MPGGDKRRYTSKQKRTAELIAGSYEKRGVPEAEAEARAWATVNKHDGGETAGGGAVGATCSKRIRSRKTVMKKTAGQACIRAVKQDNRDLPVNHFTSLGDPPQPGKPSLPESPPTDIPAAEPERRDPAPEEIPPEQPVEYPQQAPEPATEPSPWASPTETMRIPFVQFYNPDCLLCRSGLYRTEVAGDLMVRDSRQVMCEFRNDRRAHLVRYRLAQIAQRRRRRRNDEAMVGTGVKLLRQNLSEVVGELCFLIPVRIDASIESRAP